MTKAELTAENRPAYEYCKLCVMISEMAETHKVEGGVEISVILLHVLRVVLHRFPFVHGVEIELGVIVLDLGGTFAGLRECYLESAHRPHNQSWISRTHHLGSTLIDFVSSLLIVLLGWRERAEVLLDFRSPWTRTAVYAVFAHYGGAPKRWRGVAG